MDRHNPTYEANGTNGINVYLESTETDYITFTQPNKTTAELLSILKDNNDLLPGTFDPDTVYISTLDELYTTNSLVDYSNYIHQTEKVRSKKTFIHLPAPLELVDGQTFELDVSLPVEPYSEVFPFNTVGSLSGYKNFVTQPRVYVMGGYQNCSPSDITADSLTRVGTTATFVTTVNHEIYFQSFETSHVNLSDSSITVPDITQFDLGNTVRFSNSGGALPDGLTTGTDYTISNIDENRIKLTGITLSDIGSGSHTLVICNDVRILVRGADQSGYNGEFDATITDVNELQFTVSSGLDATATGEIEIDKLVYVAGKEGVKGLTERTNSQIFGAMPEIEFAEDGSLYHQPPITSDDIIGNGSTDKRVILASVYPTSTNTFPWRLDNDPQLRMYQWNLLSLSGATGSAAHVAYNRNKEIVDEFTPEYTGNVTEYDQNKTRLITTVAETDFKVGSKIVITGATGDREETIPEFYAPGDVFTITKKESKTEFEITTDDLNISDSPNLVITFKELLFDFSLEDNPLTYNSTTFHSETEITTKTKHLLNSYIRILLPDTLIPLSIADDGSGVLNEEEALLQGEITGVGSYAYQGQKAYSTLISDFHKGRILYHGEFKYRAIWDALDVETRGTITIDDAGDGETRTVDEEDISEGGIVSSRLFARDEEEFQDDSIAFLMGYDNNASTAKPTSFYDQTVGQKFIEYNTTALPDQDSRNGYRWITKGIYTPDYVVNTQDKSNRKIEDSYVDVPTALKTYLSKYFITDKERETNAGDRFIQGDLNPSVDPSFEFAVGTESLFIDHMIANEENATTINDVRRRFWDSKFEIPQIIDRKLSNRFSIETQNIVNNHNITGFTSFYGFYGIPFAKIFSSDRFAPSENVITGIENYAAIRSLYPTVENTLENALESNPIAYRFFNTEDYLDAFTSINTIDTDDAEREEYLRNYILGYSNRMPLRFYNSFRIAVYGTTDSDAHSDVNTNIERIYKYSVDEYLDEYGDVPGSFVGEYIDDNFIFRNEEIDEDGQVFTEDYNDAWLYFDDATADDSVLKDLISVSGMPYMVDKDFYRLTMKRNYTRVKMKFIFSRHAGRWLVTDYRQFPTSYLTPTFGNVALSHKEPTTVYAGSRGVEIDDYIPTIQPHPDAISSVVKISDDRKTITIAIPGDVYFAHLLFNDAVYYGTDVILYAPREEHYLTSAQILSVQHITVPTSLESTPENNPGWYYDMVLTDPVPLVFGGKLRISVVKDTLELGTYPYNGAQEKTETDLIWKNSYFLDGNDAYKKLENTPYHKLTSMRLNRFAYPFLSKDDPFTISNIISEDFWEDTATVTTTEPHGYSVGDKVIISTEVYGFSTENEWESQYDETITITVVDTVTSFTYNNPTLPDYSQTPWSYFHENRGTVYRPNFPYDNNGDRIELMNPDRDRASAERYRLNKLIDPVENIDFIVPNNVHGGKNDPNKENLKVFNPHLWKVYWHMRPAVCAMFNTDIPSKTGRTLGSMADPVLNSMFEYPNIDNTTFHIPWHADMEMDWIANDWFNSIILDAAIDDPGAKERVEYDLYDAAIDDALRERDRACYTMLDATRWFIE